MVSLLSKIRNIILRVTLFGVVSYPFVCEFVVASDQCDFKPIATVANPFEEFNWNVAYKNSMVPLYDQLVATGESEEYLKELFYLYKTGNPRAITTVAYLSYFKCLGVDLIFPNARFEILKGILAGDPKAIILMSVISFTTDDLLFFIQGSILGMLSNNTVSKSVAYGYISNAMIWERFTYFGSPALGCKFAYHALKVNEFNPMAHLMMSKCHFEILTVDYAKAYEHILMTQSMHRSDVVEKEKNIRLHLSKSTAEDIKSKVQKKVSSRSSKP